MLARFNAGEKRLWGKGERRYLEHVAGTGFGNFDLQCPGTAENGEWAASVKDEGGHKTFTLHVKICNLTTHICTSMSWVVQRTKRSPWKQMREVATLRA